MKTDFIKIIQMLHQFNLIESKVILMTNESEKNVSKLTTKNISNGFIIYEKIMD